MKLILHLVRKDFLRLRGWLALWVLTLAVKFAIGCYLIFGSSVGSVPADFSKTFSDLSIMAEVLVAIEMGLTFLIAALLVQEDVLVGTTSFWITRPIAGGRLLVAKFLGAFLLLGLPAVALSLPWWLVCGFGMREIGPAALETFGWQLVVMAPAFLVAALTDSLSRFLLWTCTLVVGMVAVPLLWGQWISDGIRYFVASGTLLALAAFLGVVAAVVAHQFLTRRVRTSLAILAVGLVMTTGIGLTRPWNPNGYFDEPWTESNAALGASVKLTVLGSDVGVRRPGDDRLDSLAVGLMAQGAPRRLALVGVESRNTWRWEGGSSIVRDGIASNLRSSGGLPELWPVLGLGEYQFDAETAQWYAEREAAHGRKFFVPGQDVTLGEQVGVSHSVLKRLQDLPPAYAMTANLYLMRPEQLLEIPLQPGRWQAHGGRGLRVLHSWDETFPENRYIGARVSRKLNVIETTPFLAKEVLWDTWHSRLPYVRGQLAKYLAVSRSYRDANTASDQGGPVAVRLGSVVIQEKTLWMPAPLERRGGKLTQVHADWLDGATLAVVGWEEEARFTGQAATERFEVRDPDTAAK